MSESPNVLPTYSGEAEPYWQGLREGEVRLQYCKSCETYQFYPRPICAGCWSDDIEWRAVEASGTVYSFSVPGFAPHPSFKARMPYVVALVDLDVGVRIMGNIVDCDPDTVSIGMRVDPVISEIEEGHSLLNFKPQQGAQA